MASFYTNAYLLPLVSKIVHRVIKVFCKISFFTQTVQGMSRKNNLRTTITKIKNIIQIVSCNACLSKYKFYQQFCSYLSKKNSNKLNPFHSVSKLILVSNYRTILVTVRLLCSHRHIHTSFLFIH